MRTTQWLCILVILALALPAFAAAQEDPAEAIIWLSMVQAKEGQSEALTRTIVEQNSGLYDQLMADGAVLSWGVVQPFIHRPGQDYSHVEVVVFPDWAGVDAFVGAFMSSMMAMSPEERQAQQEAFEKVVEPGSHYDVVNRGVHLGGAPQGRPAYFNLAYFKTKPGSDMMDLYKEYAVPVFEKLSADGAIGQFGMEVQEIHGDHSWTYMAWYAMPDLGARDAVEAAFDAIEAARTEEENAAWQERFAATMVPDTHWDDIMLVVHWANASEGGEGNGGEGDE